MKKNKPKNSYFLFGLILIVIGSVFYITIVSYLYSFFVSGSKIKPVNQRRSNVINKADNNIVDPNPGGYFKQIDRNFVEEEWTPYTAKQLPLELILPSEAKIQEVPEQHSLNITTDRILSSLNIHIYLTKYPSSTQYKEKALIENTNPYAVEKWMREYEDETAELIPLDGYKEVFYKSIQGENSTVYYLIAHSKAKWSFGIAYLERNRTLDSELVKSYLVKVASGIKFNEITPDIFSQYWTPDIGSIPQN